MQILKLVIAADPVPKSRPRHSNGHTYTPKRTRDAEEVIAGHCRAAMGLRVPVTEPLGIRVVFHCATRRRSDGDNLLKLVTDAMNKIVMADDSQIVDWSARLYRGVGKENARTEIEVWTLDPQ